ncbi:hypothetical protein CPC16_005742, partial [Podila verticillata]
MLLPSLVNYALDSMSGLLHELFATYASGEKEDTEGFLLNYVKFISVLTSSSENFKSGGKCRLLLKDIVVFQKFAMTLSKEQYLR